jgi:hypothetical protein
VILETLSILKVTLVLVKPEKKIGHRSIPSGHGAYFFLASYQFSNEGKLSGFSGDYLKKLWKLWKRRWTNRRMMA